MIKRLLSLGVALVFVLALVAPVLLAVPASAADFVSLDDLAVTYRLYKYGSGNSYFPRQETFSSQSGSLLFYFYVTNGTSDSDFVWFPVGDSPDEIYISSAMYLDAESVTAGSKTDIGYRVAVYCYDSSGNSLGTIYSAHNMGNPVSGLGTSTVSVSGAQFPVGTSYFSVCSNFCGSTSDFVTSENSSIAGTFSGVVGFSIHTSEFDWVSPGLGSISSAQPVPFAFSHEGQQVYLSEGDHPILSILAEGFSGVDMYARFFSLNGTTKTVQMFYDADRVCHYNSFAYNFTDEDSYNTLWVDFLINDKVIYSSQACTLYNSGWSGSNPGSGAGTTTDSAISESITEVQEDVQAVMDAVGETNDKLDNLQGAFDDIVSGDSGVDSSVTDFNSVSDSLSSSLSDANAVIDSGVESLNGFVSSEQMLGTAAALGSLLSAAFVGNEISICGISGNPFELAVVFFGSMGVIVLVITYVFRKRGGG